MSVGNKIKNFLIFCAGSSKEILQKCPSTEWIKHTSTGATVLFTSIIAMLSSFYAFQLIFTAFYISLPLALFWGLIIFNLDRYIVSSFRKYNKPVKEFMQALPRMLLAVAIAVVISKPLELEIFKSEIRQSLVESRKKSLSNLEAQHQKTIKIQELKIHQLNTELSGYFNLKEKYYRDYICECDGTCGTGQKGRGTECKVKKQKYEESAIEFSAQKTRIDALIVEVQKEISNQNNEFKTDKITLDNNFSYGFLARLNALNNMDNVASFSITLLLILIEITPILSKLFAPEGPYDHLICMGEHEYKTKYLRSVHQQNMDLPISLNENGRKTVDIFDKNKLADQSKSLEKYRYLKEELEKKLKK